MNHKEPNFDAEIKKEIKELKSNIEDLKETYIKQLSHFANKLPDAIQKGEDKIIERPFSSVGVAIAIGCVLGALFVGRK